MEAAALAMAEAAAEEAAARERNARAGVAQMPLSLEPAAMSGDPMVDQVVTGATDDVELLQKLMSLPDDNARNQFLQLLTQQEQQHQQQQEMEEALRMRPHTHYLTISTEGTFSFARLLYKLLLVCLSNTSHSHFVVSCIACVTTLHNINRHWNNSRSHPNSYRLSTRCSTHALLL